MHAPLGYQHACVTEARQHACVTQARQHACVTASRQHANVTANCSQDQCLHLACNGSLQMPQYQQICSTTTSCRTLCTAQFLESRWLLVDGASLPVLHSVCTCPAACDEPVVHAVPAVHALPAVHAGLNGAINNAQERQLSLTQPGTHMPASLVRSSWSRSCLRRCSSSSWMESSPSP